MDSVRDAAKPRSGSPDLLGASISLDHQEIAPLQTEPLQLPFEQFNPMHIREVQGATSHIRNAEEWIGVIDRLSLLLLLNSPTDIGDLIEGYPSPPRRKFCPSQASS